MLGLLAYISVAGAWFWARSLHPAIVTWPTRIATGTRRRRKPVGRGGVHPGWRHATQPQERACRQGWGAALPLAGMTGHQRLVRAGGRRLPRETLSCSHQRLARARTTLAIARQGGLPVPMRGSVVSLRSGCAPGGVCRCPCGEARCVQEGQGMPMQGVAGRTCMALARRNCRRRIVLRDPAHGIQICAMSKMSAGRQDNTSSADDHSQL